MDAAIKRLLRHAVTAGPGARSLKGEDGLVATFEASEVGPARRVRISREGADVHWTFMLEPGEPRPAFYPDDLPFLEGPPCTLVWHVDRGLRVLWMLDPPRDIVPELERRLSTLEAVEPPGGTEAFTARFAAADREGKLALMEEFHGAISREDRERLKDAFADLFGAGLSDAALDRVAEVVAFHRDRGWTVEAGEPTGPPGSYARVFRKDGRERKLSAMAAMATTIAVAEAPPSRTAGPPTGPPGTP